MPTKPGDKAVLLGTRGSVPASGKGYIKYGGATLCVFLRLAGVPLVIDAGTGLLSLLPQLEDGENIALLLSHAHADHILGLTMSPVMFRTDTKTDIYAVPRVGLCAEEQADSIFSPPLWPVDIHSLPTETTFHDIRGAFDLGALHVDVFDGVHPGGVTAFRITGGGKTVVYCSDCTLDAPALEKMLPFAENCDLLLCDGQYTAAEWTAFSTFGHSTWHMAAELAQKSRARKLRIVHHSPFRTDSELDSMQSELLYNYRHSDFSFGYDGEEILL